MDENCRIANRPESFLAGFLSGGKPHGLVWVLRDVAGADRITRWPIRPGPSSFARSGLAEVSAFSIRKACGREGSSRSDRLGGMVAAGPAGSRGTVPGRAAAGDGPGRHSRSDRLAVRRLPRPARPHRPRLPTGRPPCGRDWSARNPAGACRYCTPTGFIRAADVSVAGSAPRLGHGPRSRSETSGHRYHQVVRRARRLPALPPDQSQVRR